jgi:hypothetical protein
MAILICGALARFVVGKGASDLSPAPGNEIHNVAVSLAVTGRFANPFGYPSYFSAVLETLVGGRRVKSCARNPRP